jgi:pyrroloquinoline quinone biosynthesis protein B
VHIKILGSAAGGGFPQWNCACRNCRELRAGKLNASPRTQCQVAVSGSHAEWFLLNASPDLRMQIVGTLELDSRGHLRDPEGLGERGVRHSPIVGVVLTGGDLDQVLGLLHLRELEPLHIYATASIRRLLREQNIFFNMLSQQPWQSVWTDIVPGESLPLATSAQSVGKLVCQTISLGGVLPAYVGEKQAADVRPDEAILGLFLQSSEDGERMAYLPAVPAVDDRLLSMLESCDLVLFDGTFWTDDELVRVQGGGRSARQMGHLPISGPEGSLARLAKLSRPHKVFVHINNTNPILDKDSPQYREVREAGWDVAEDGWEFRLRQAKPTLAL